MDTGNISSDLIIRSIDGVAITKTSEACKLDHGVNRVKEKWSESETSQGPQVHVVIDRDHVLDMFDPQLDDLIMYG